MSQQSAWRNWRKNLGWAIKVTKVAFKQLEKINKFSQKRILNFLHSKLENTADPRMLGKALTGHSIGIWRYRVGDYRIICDIQDKTVTILVVTVGHRKEVYRKK
ncbi:MAG: type II toxin-antitoxin system RelE/ParE family toxin [Gammaproteobacteria bacterium]|nr:type II toxin-antitoxin system RelE/ParE family toxin [Gammaproteobacteria bacterium]